MRERAAAGRGVAGARDRGQGEIGERGAGGKAIDGHRQHVDGPAEHVGQTTAEHAGVLDTDQPGAGRANAAVAMGR